MRGREFIRVWSKYTYTWMHKLEGLTSHKPRCSKI
jgi:hypothetical protein